MSEQYLLLLLLAHWICDFVLQTHEEATNKWHSFRALLGHTWTYSLGMTLALGWSLPYSALFAFFGLTLLLHTLTDFFTSKWVHKLFEKKDYHNGFVVIGLDQILHYVQLYLTLKLLT